MIWHCAKYEFDLSTPVLMGVLNITPDSFSDGGEFMSVDAACAHAEKMLSEGARIIDVGGESSRPGAAAVPPQEEWERIEPVLRELAALGICVSVDTRHAQVACAAVAAGAAIINDISGFTDPEMVEVASASDAGLVVMHMKGTPSNMDEFAHYDDIVTEVRDYLATQCATLENAGVSHSRICVDPGPGFAKTPEQTIELMRNLHEIVHLGYPVMVAASRKRYLAAAYHLESSDPKSRDDASGAEALAACELGATIVRTHNVAKTAAYVSQLRPYVLIGLGCNKVCDERGEDDTVAKIEQLNSAIACLCKLPDSQVIDVAPFYISEPAYYEDQDEFVNTVALVRSGNPPLELLGYLHEIENSLGRVREIPNGPRTMDLDILDYQLYVAASPELTLPHPRIAERDFVVKPLEDILPGHILADGTLANCVPEERRVGKARRVSATRVSATTRTQCASCASRAPRAHSASRAPASERSV